jgi:hypothetical protein
MEAPLSSSSSHCQQTPAQSIRQLDDGYPRHHVRCTGLDLLEAASEPAAGTAAPAQDAGGHRQPLLTTLLQLYDPHVNIAFDECRLGFFESCARKMPWWHCRQWTNKQTGRCCSNMFVMLVLQSNPLHMQQPAAYAYNQENLVCHGDLNPPPSNYSSMASAYATHPRALL